MSNLSTVSIKFKEATKQLFYANSPAQNTLARIHSICTESQKLMKEVIKRNDHEEGVNDITLEKITTELRNYYQQIINLTSSTNCTEKTKKIIEQLRTLLRSFMIESEAFLASSVDAYFARMEGRDMHGLDGFAFNRLINNSDDLDPSSMLGVPEGEAEDPTNYLSLF